MKNVRPILLAVILAAGGIASSSFAQEVSPDRRVKFWISFVDKEAGFGKGPLTVEPGRVSRRAAERRAKRGRTSRTRAAHLDAPVSPRYIERLERLGIQPIIESRWLNAVSAYLTPVQSLQVAGLPYVRSISPVARSVGPDIHAASPIPLDYGSSETQLQSINAIEPIEDGFIGEGVILGFLDTTTDTMHAALEHLADSGQIIATRDFTVEAGLTAQTNKHGLRVSSVAMGFDEGQLVGPCYGAEYILGTTEYAPFEENQEEDFFVAGMEWMEQMGADIVNVSLGYSTFDPGEDSYTYEDMDGNTAKTTIVSDMAVGLGVLVVSSAGNSGCSDPDDCWYYITSPADGDSVIAVGAVNLSGDRAGFSGRGPSYDGRIKPDLAAPGTSVRSAITSGGYANGSGTSFSSPLVAGVACQVLQANPDLTPMEVRTLLRATASQSNDPDNDLGWGIVNAGEAVRLAQLGDTTAPYLIDLTLTPDTADVTTEDTAAVVTVWAGDSLSGIRSIRACLTDPSENEHCEIGTAPDSGNAISGKWILDFPLPQLSEIGTWHISELSLQDSVVMLAEFDSSGLAVLGYPTDVEVITAFDLEATILLEGPYAGGGMMTTGATHQSAIPLTQPFDSSAYSGTPLDYAGTEAVAFVPPGAVDWVLVSLREDSSAVSVVAESRQAVLLMNDGSLADTGGVNPRFLNMDTLSYHVVVRTRNHGSVMSSSPVDFSSGHGVWDFSSSGSSAYTPGPPALQMVAAGEYALFACDIDHNGQITAADFNEWLTATKAGATGFRQEDCTFDGAVTAADFNFWLANTKTGAGSTLPE